MEESLLNSVLLLVSISLHIKLFECSPLISKEILSGSLLLKLKPESNYMYNTRFLYP